VTDGEFCDELSIDLTPGAFRLIPHFPGRFRLLGRVGHSYDVCQCSSSIDYISLFYQSADECPTCTHTRIESRPRGTKC